jgi:hypothetical protein
MLFQKLFDLVVAALGHELQAVGFISKYHTAVQTDPEFVISRGQLLDARAAMGMRIAKVHLSVSNRQTYGAPLTLGLSSKCMRNGLIEINGFQSNQSGLNGPSNRVVRPSSR